MYPFGEAVGNLHCEHGNPDIDLRIEKSGIPHWGHLEDTAVKSFSAASAITAIRVGL